jgi:hypothetical protein
LKEKRDRTSPYFVWGRTGPRWPPPRWDKAMTRIGMPAMTGELHACKVQRLYQGMNARHLTHLATDILRRYSTRHERRGAVLSAEGPLMETKMQKAALTILGALLIAGSAAQMAAASEHHARAGRGHHQWDYRGSYNQLKQPSTPAANETRSCDVVWCYPD